MKFQIAVSAVKPLGAGRQGSEGERGTFSGLTSSYANQGAPQTDSHLPPGPEEERRRCPSPQTWLSQPTSACRDPPGLSRGEDTPSQLGAEGSLSPHLLQGETGWCLPVQALEHGLPLGVTCFLHLSGRREVSLSVRLCRNSKSQAGTEAEETESCGLKGAPTHQVLPKSLGPGPGLCCSSGSVMGAPGAGACTGSTRPHPRLGPSAGHEGCDGGVSSGHFHSCPSKEGISKGLKLLPWGSG